MKKIGFISVSIVSAIILVLGIWQLVKVYTHTSTHFPKNTIINEVDCSDLTVDEAADRLTQAWNKKSVEIREDGQVVGKLSDFDFTYDIKEALEKEISPSIVKPVFNSLLNKEDKITIPMKIKEETESFATQVTGYTFLDRPYNTKTQNAYIDMSNTEFKIIKEVYGDNIDKSKFKKKLMKSISKGDKVLKFVAKDYYETPTITSDSESILERQQYCEKYLSLIITHNIYTGSVTMTPDILNKIISVDDQGTVSVNEAEVATYVNNLSAKANTIGRDRNFKSTSDGTIKVSGGNYGYFVNHGEEVKTLVNDVKEGKDVNREPVYSRRPYSNAADEIGNSYVEIDISGQKIWLYKNGKQVVTSDIVTGNVKMGSATPTGMYGLTYKERDTVLRGQNYDGTDYESPVKYWMPFNGDIGMHDASWRKTFGKKYYLTEGSKGCVNLPTSVAATIYSSIEAGFPVIVHY